MPKYTFFQKFEGWEEFSQQPLDQRLPVFFKDDRIYDVLFSQQFSRPLIDTLYELTNRIRKIAKNCDFLTLHLRFLNNFR